MNSNDHQAILTTHNAGFPPAAPQAHPSSRGGDNDYVRYCTMQIGSIDGVDVMPFEHVADALRDGATLQELLDFTAGAFSGPEYSDPWL